MEKESRQITKSNTENEKIGDITDKIHQRTDPSNGENYLLYSFSAYDNNEKIPVIESGENIKSAKYEVPDNSVLISKLNPRINRVWRVKKSSDNAICSTEFMVLKPKEGVPLDYVYAVLSAPNFRNYLSNFTTGTSGSHQRVRQGDILEYEMRKSTSYEKKAIALIYGLYDNKIETNNQINRTLEAIAQAIFRSWFIDYEPFSGQEFEYHEGVAEKIPKDWDIKQMSQIARTIDCLHSKKPDIKDEGRFYIEVKDIGKSGELNLDDKSLISEEDYNEWTRRIIAKEGDVIISKTGRVGAVAQIPERIEGAIGRNLVCIRPASEKLSSPFLKEYMISPLMRKEIGRKSLSGTVLESLHVKEIENLRVVVPPKDVRQRFDETVGHLHKRINLNIKENELLKQIRDTLLPKLMSGEIKVDDISLDNYGIESGE